MRFPVGLCAGPPAPHAVARARSTDGFSLIELLCTVAIILILYTLYFTGGSAQRQAKEKAHCQRNLENIYVALKTFTLDHNDAFPVATNASSSEAPLSLLVPRYTSVTEFF